MFLNLKLQDMVSIIFLKSEREIKEEIKSEGTWKLVITAFSLVTDDRINNLFL